MRETRKITRLAYYIIPGLLVRLLVAPFTCGSDIAQFAGFADTFLRHGFEFMKYSGSENYLSEGWPYPWPYVYGPIFILILAFLRVIASGKINTYYDASGVYHVKVPVDWIIANKLLYIAFDTIAAIEIYWIVSRITGRERTALLSMLLYYCNPIVIYISSIYGMFDQIVLALMLAGIIVYLERGSWLILSIIWGLAVSIKQSIMIPMIPFYAYLSVDKSRWIGVKALTTTLIVFLLPYTPFLLGSPEGVTSYYNGIRAVSTPNYYSPPEYSFNGFSTIAFYAWIHANADVQLYLAAWPLLFIPLYIASLYYTVKYRMPLIGVALAQVSYTASYWRVNPQYIVVSIGLLVVAIALLKRRLAEFLALSTVVVAGLWPEIYPVSFWARVHVEEPNYLMEHVLSHISLNIYDDLFYIYYSLALTITQLFLLVTLYFDVEPGNNTISHNTHSNIK